MGTRQDAGGSPAEPEVTVDSEGPVLIVTLSRPHKRNAINGAVTTQLAAAFDRLEADESLRVGVLTGAGGCFSSGADLRAGPAGEHLHDAHGFASLTRRRRNKPVIAAVEGAAYAGGFEIVLSCDIVVAASDATFGLPEVKRGVLAGTGLYRLPRNIGFSVAAQIALTGDPIGAERAFGLGLVSALTEPGEALPASVEMARVIAANAPGSLRESLHVLRDSFGLDDDAAEQLGREALRRLAGTSDFREGPRAFVEHRAPRWTGH
jgi:enoyl-CoA hydratase